MPSKALAKGVKNTDTSPTRQESRYLDLNLDKSQQNLQTNLLTFYLLARSNNEYGVGVPFKILEI